MDRGPAFSELKTQRSIWVPKDLHSKVMQYCKAHGIKVSHVYSTAVEQYINKQRNQTNEPDNQTKTDSEFDS